MTDYSFQSLRVVELGSVLAVPAVGMFFAELGATVIKIENATTQGDVTRSWKLPSEDPASPASAYFYSVNYGKQHLMLDLNTSEHQAQVWDLVRTADIVLSNFKMSSAERIGMDYPTLRALKPDLIYAQLHGFDETDDTPALDMVLQAETGFLYMTGELGGPPVKMPVALIDLLAAHQLKEGILMALLARQTQGKGALVSTSLYKAALASLANQATNWLMAGVVPQRIGTAHPNIMPYGDVYTTHDNKEVVLACASDKHWQSLCRALGLEALLASPLYRTNALRVQHRPQLMALIQAKIEPQHSQALAAVLKAAGVPFGVVKNLPEVFESPMASGMILSETHPDGSVSHRVRTVAFSITTSE